MCSEYESFCCRVGKNERVENVVEMCDCLKKGRSSTPRQTCHALTVLSDGREMVCVSRYRGFETDIVCRGSSKKENARSQASADIRFLGALRPASMHKSMRPQLETRAESGRPRNCCAFAPLVRVRNRNWTPTDT